MFAMGRARRSVSTKAARSVDELHASPSIMSGHKDSPATRIRSRTCTLGSRLLAAAGPFPVAFLRGPRQSGKTTLARATFLDYRYVSLEDLQNRAEAQEDPRGFLARLRGAPSAILDEVQRVPDLSSYPQGVVDDGSHGPFVLTGPQRSLLSRHIGQTLAGRVAAFELLPLSTTELLERPPACTYAGRLSHGCRPRAQLEAAIGDEPRRPRPT